MQPVSKERASNWARNLRPPTVYARKEGTLHRTYSALTSGSAEALSTVYRETQVVTPWETKEYTPNPDPPKQDPADSSKEGPDPGKGKP